MILGLETSCDETAAALVTRAGEIRSSVVASQAALHARFGGVVPEVASRRHLELVGPVVREALAEADATLDDVGLVAVTPAPGSSARCSSASRPPRRWLGEGPAARAGRPSARARRVALPRAGSARAPFLCLLATGGHTLLLDVRDRGGYRTVGTTIDDAAGEAFDKGARLLGLGYPGGAALDRLAAEGDAEAYDFPVARLDGLDFSFSGVKTALLYAVRDLAADELERRRADLAASYQRAIVRALVSRTRAAADGLGHGRIAVVGGVAANSELRASLPEATLAPLALCTDNAAMIASAARFVEPLAPSAYLDLDAHAAA